MITKPITISVSPSYLCTWDGDATVEIHTSETLHAKYDQTNLFDPTDWTHDFRPEWPRNTPKWTSRGADLDIILANMKAGDAWSSDNCNIRRIK